MTKHSCKVCEFLLLCFVSSLTISSRVFLISAQINISVSVFENSRLSGFSWMSWLDDSSPRLDGSWVVLCLLVHLIFLTTFFSMSWSSPRSPLFFLSKSLMTRKMLVIYLFELKRFHVIRFKRSVCPFKDFGDKTWDRNMIHYAFGSPYHHAYDDDANVDADVDKNKRTCKEEYVSFFFAIVFVVSWLESSISDSESLGRFRTFCSPTETWWGSCLIPECLNFSSFSPAKFLTLILLHWFLSFFAFFHCPLSFRTRDTVHTLLEKSILEKGCSCLSFCSTKFLLMMI